jgi:hypothetical protein
MKIYVLLFNKDIQSTPGSIDELVKISKDKDELELTMESTNMEIDEHWDDDESDWDGVLFSYKPYMWIKEQEL